MLAASSARLQWPPAAGAASGKQWRPRASTAAASSRRAPITGFGSVHVNGVRYVTSGAAFIIDDQPGSESDLRVGQVVRIEGTLDAGGTTGIATRVIFDDEVEGPVQSIDLPNARLVVLGRTVQVGPRTSFDDSIVPRSLDGIVVGDRIEVSGFPAIGWHRNATRIERKAAQGSYEIKGTVASLDTNARRFNLGALTVSYASAQLSGFASGQPANGDTVEAVGTLDGTGMLVASRVERESESGGTSDDDADYEGLITRFVSATDFSVDGQRVTTTSATTYEGGSVADLALDASVEVEGRFNSAGVIVASKVQFRRSGELEIAAPVDSVNAAAGSLVVLGVTLRTNPLTRVRGSQRCGSAAVQPREHRGRRLRRGPGLRRWQRLRGNARRARRPGGRHRRARRQCAVGRGARFLRQWRRGDDGRQYRIQGQQRRAHRQRRILPGGRERPAGEGAGHARGQRRTGRTGRARGLTGVPGYGGRANEHVRSDQYRAYFEV